MAKYYSPYDITYIYIYKYITFSGLCFYFSSFSNLILWLLSRAEDRLFSSWGNSVFNQKVSAAQTSGILTNSSRLLIILEEWAYQNTKCLQILQVYSNMVRVGISANMPWDTYGGFFYSFLSQKKTRSHVTTSLNVCFINPSAVLWSLDMMESLNLCK